MDIELAKALSDCEHMCNVLVNRLRDNEKSCEQSLGGELLEIFNEANNEMLRVTNGVKQQISNLHHR